MKNSRINTVLKGLVTVSFLLTALPPRAEEPEQPQAVGICQLLANPIAYQHKLIQVTGRVQRGFEDFTIRGASCEDASPFWLEYGGPQPAEVVYCCVGGEAHPPNGTDPLWIDGIQTSLTRDAAFKRFDSKTRHLRRGKSVQATFIGRVFAAGVYTSDSGQEEVGYGHFGIFSLLVIQQVLEVGRAQRNDGKPSPSH